MNKIALLEPLKAIHTHMYMYMYIYRERVNVCLLYLYFFSAFVSQIYRFREQTLDSSVFGVIGKPISQSKSPHIHNAAFRECGKNSVYVPLLVDDIESFLGAFSHELFPDFRGFSVTIPHKVCISSCSFNKKRDRGKRSCANLSLLPRS